MLFDSRAAARRSGGAGAVRQPPPSRAHPGTGAGPAPRGPGELRARRGSQPAPALRARRSEGRQGGGGAATPPREACREGCGRGELQAEGPGRQRRGETRRRALAGGGGCSHLAAALSRPYMRSHVPALARPGPAPALRGAAHCALSDGGCAFSGGRAAPGGGGGVSRPRLSAPQARGRRGASAESRWGAGERGAGAPSRRAPDTAEDGLAAAGQP